MALPSTIYRANIQLTDVDRSTYEALQATIARHPSETAERLVLRLLAYSICYAPNWPLPKESAPETSPICGSRGAMAGLRSGSRWEHRSRNACSRRPVMRAG